MASPSAALTGRRLLPAVHPVGISIRNGLRVYISKFAGDLVPYIAQYSLCKCFKSSMSRELLAYLNVQVSFIWRILQLTVFPFPSGWREAPQALGAAYRACYLRSSFPWSQGSYAYWCCPSPYYARRLLCGFTVTTQESPNPGSSSSWESSLGWNSTPPPSLQESQCHQSWTLD